MTTFAPTPASGRIDHLFTVEEYLRMVEIGILTKNDKVELLNGRIVEKTHRNTQHEAALQRVHALLMKACPTEWIVRVASPLLLESSAPEPDAMIIRGPFQRYDDHFPDAQDTLLVVEVSESTPRYDRTNKLRMYAAAHIPTYWIVNLIDRHIEIYSDPTGPGDFPTYRIRRDVEENSTLQLAFPDGPSIDFNVKDMLSTKAPPAHRKPPQ